METTLRIGILDALTELYSISEVQFAVEEPKDLTNGDYASNVALVVAKQLGKGPMEVAEAIADYLRTHRAQPVSTVSVAAPGFINISLKPGYFAETIGQIDEVWGSSTRHAGKQILVEHSSPNLFKPFHIGHLMNNTIGESITRLARASGATVSTMSFPSDISLGVAKAIFIILEKHLNNDQIFKPKDIVLLGEAYTEGVKRYDEDPSVQSRVKEIADNIYAKTPSPELNVFEACKAFNMEYFQWITGQLGSHFDSYIYESEAGVKGKEIVLANTPKVFSESEGAIVYVPEESRKDINTAVFINSQGNPTYEAKDIGLLDLKFEQYNPDLSIFITDVQQVPHFQVVLAAAEQINTDWVQKSLHRYHGRMSFKGQKMSSRLGGVPLVTEILGVVGEEVRKKNPDITSDAAETIGIAAIKFAILRAQAGKNIDFDPDTSLSFVGDSGPYLQYSVVRARSVIAKRGDIAINATLPGGWQTTTLEQTLIHFPEVVNRAIEEWAPHHLVSYLLELAQSFNSWYAEGKIVDATDPHSPYKLALTQSYAAVMTHGLDLLGISVPEKM